MKIYVLKTIKNARFLRGMKINRLLEMQRDLDRLILNKANIQIYPTEMVKMALLVELGELANEIQFFKYWKHNKNINQEKIKEEWADCFHFSLSLENRLMQLEGEVIDNLDLFEELYKAERLENKSSVYPQFNAAFENVINLDDVLKTIIGLGLCIGLSLNEMEKAYIDKYLKNIQRQQEGY